LFPGQWKRNQLRRRYHRKNSKGRRWPCETKLTIIKCKKINEKKSWKFYPWFYLQVALDWIHCGWNLKFFLRTLNQELAKWFLGCSQDASTIRVPWQSRSQMFVPLGTRLVPWLYWQTTKNLKVLYAMLACHQLLPIPGCEPVIRKVWVSTSTAIDSWCDWSGLNGRKYGCRCLHLVYRDSWSGLNDTKYGDLHLDCWLWGDCDQIFDGKYGCLHLICYQFLVDCDRDQVLMTQNMDVPPPHLLQIPGFETSWQKVWMSPPGLLPIPGYETKYGGFLVAVIVRLVRY
jgi:hypothetical protein